MARNYSQRYKSHFADKAGLEHHLVSPEDPCVVYTSMDNILNADGKDSFKSEWAGDLNDSNIDHPEYDDYYYTNNN